MRQPIDRMPEGPGARYLGLRCGRAEIVRSSALTQAYIGFEPLQPHLDWLRANSAVQRVRLHQHSMSGRFRPSVRPSDRILWRKARHDVILPVTAYGAFGPVQRDERRKSTKVDHASLPHAGVETCIRDASRSNRLRRDAGNCTDRGWQLQVPPLRKIDGAHDDPDARPWPGDA